MNIVTQLWDVQELIDNRGKINPKPQYQRTPVWTTERKAFLIDSLLRGYDLPKFYINNIANGNPFEYEVADGQQRIRSIWDFFDGIYQIGKNVVINGIDLSGFYFDDLPEELKHHFLKFDLNFTVILTHKQGELNELFTRLQKGVSLNPVELRHAMFSNIGFYMSKFLEKKSIIEFFKESKIPDQRFKHQDFIDHIIALIHFKNKKDLKAAIIAQLYIEFADSDLNQYKGYFDKAEKVLKKMADINTNKKGIFKNKWAFVDVFWLLYKNINSLDTINAKTFANIFIDFESNRIKYNSKPERILKLKNHKYGKNLFDCIQAFNKEGANKSNLEIRSKVFKEIFTKIL